MRVNPQADVDGAREQVGNLIPFILQRDLHMRIISFIVVQVTNLTSQSTHSEVVGRPRGDRNGSIDLTDALSPQHSYLPCQFLPSLTHRLSLPRLAFLPLHPLFLLSSLL